MGSMAGAGSAASRPRVGAAVASLRAQGERVTRARRAVLEVLDGTVGHLNADEIARRVTELSPGVHRATVYRALATLGELGMVTHTHVGGSATVYHLAVTEETAGTHPAHAHAQCTSCGAVIDVPTEALRALSRRLERDLDFRLEAQHAALLGTCSRCLGAEA